MSEIPEAQASGVDGTQAVGSALIPATVAPPLQATNVPDAIDGLIATHSRNLGGDIAARLLAASMRDTSNQLAAAHETISAKDVELKTANSSITELKVCNAELNAKLNAAIGTVRTKQVTTFIGAALLGIAIDLFKSNMTPYAWALVVLGAGLLVVAILPTKGSKPL